jgi:hypothetical protein
MLALRLKQDVVYESDGEKFNLKFTLFKPGQPKIISITPGVDYEMKHELLKNIQNVSASWRVIKPEDDHNNGVSVSDGGGGGYVFPPQFCGSGRSVGVLYCEGTDVATGKKGTVIERRVACLTQEEGMKLFGWTLNDNFTGGRVMLVLEKYLPLGVDAWNLRIFANTSPSPAPSTQSQSLPGKTTSTSSSVYEIGQIDCEGSWPQMGTCENFENYLSLVRIPWPLK